MRNKYSFSLLALLLLLNGPVFAEESYLKIGAGTDASLGLAVGAEYQLTLQFGSQTIRMGPAFYYNSWSETTEEINTYDESATTYIFGVSANSYFQADNNSNLAFILGGGAAFISYEWQETSEGDSSIGPLVNGVYTDTDEGSGASVFFNAGLSRSFSNNLAVEVNVPMFLVPYGYGTTIAPAVIVSLVVPL